MANPLPEWQRDMARAVDDKLMRDLVNDFRNYSPVPRPEGPAATVRVTSAGAVASGDDGAKHRGSGWTEPPSIDSWRAPGLEIMNRLVDEQDAIDKAKRALELGQAAHINKQLKAKARS